MGCRAKHPAPNRQDPIIVWDPVLFLLGKTAAYGSDRLRLLVSVRTLIYRHSRTTRILFVGNISIIRSNKRSVAVLAQTETSQTIANGLLL